MRRPDQPGEVPRQPGPAPDRLAQRLAALPDGHPSAADYAAARGMADSGTADSDVAESQENVADELADQASGEPAGDELAGREALTQRHGPGDAAGRHPASHMIIGGSGEPYRPWFTAGEPGEPWFTAGPGGPPG